MRLDIGPDNPQDHHKKGDQERCDEKGYDLEIVSSVKVCLKKGKKIPRLPIASSRRRAVRGNSAARAFA